MRGGDGLPTLPNLDTRAFSYVVVDGEQSPKASPIEQCCCTEIHTPDFFDRGHDVFVLAQPSRFVAS